VINEASPAHSGSRWEPHLNSEVEVAARATSGDSDRRRNRQPLLVILISIAVLATGSSGGGRGRSHVPGKSGAGYPGIGCSRRTEQSPRTGQPPVGVASVTVIADSLTWADIDATAAYVKGPAAARWLRSRPIRSALVVWADGRKTRLTGTRPSPEDSTPAGQVRLQRKDDR
jgi:ApbE family